MEDPAGQPIPLIEIQNDEDAKKYVFTVNPAAITILQDIKDKKVQILIDTICNLNFSGRSSCYFRTSTIRQVISSQQSA